MIPANINQANRSCNHRRFEEALVNW